MKSVTFAFVLLFAGYAFGQESGLRGNVFGIVGVTALHNDESYLGIGLDVGGGAGFLITPRLELEFEVDRVSFLREFGGGIRFEGSALTIGGNAKFYFGSGKVRPFISGGVATVHFEDRSIGVIPDRILESTTDSFSIQGGGGVRFFITPRVSLRPEFRWTFNDISFANQWRGSVAIAYHW